MSPRRYHMKKRSEAVADTRLRIVEAAMQLHGEKGILATSWKDIAQEADVALGTVYKHFPTLAELVPACGELLMQRIRPPSAEDADHLIGDATLVSDRLRRVATALFAFYERGGRHLESDLRERELPAIREWEDYLRGVVAHLVGTALRPAAPTVVQARIVSALFDFPSFKAMNERGFNPSEAADALVAMVVCWLEQAKESPGS